MDETDRNETGLLLGTVNSNVSFNDYLNVNDQVLTLRVLTDEEIVASVRSPEQSSSSSTEDEDLDEPHPVVLLKDAQEAIVTLRRFFELQEEGSNYFDLVAQMNCATKVHTMKNIKQTKITDYFPPTLN